MKWQYQTLDGIVDFLGGGTPSKQRAEFWDGDIPWVSPRDMGRRHVMNTADHITEVAIARSATQLVPKGSVLVVVRSGILARHLPVAIAGRSLTFNQDIKALVPSQDVLAEFLVYYLEATSSHVLRNLVKLGATVHSVDFERFKKIRVPTPPLDEQRRIVAILDKADRLGQLRSKAEAKAGRVLPALFIKMFGDPVTNPMGWPAAPLGELCRIVSGATPRTNRPEYWGGHIAWATPKDLSGLKDWVLEGTARTLTEEGLESCSATLLPGETVLLSSRAPIGLVAISGVPACTNQGFKSLVCGPEIDPWYLFGWCKVCAGYLQSLGQGATFKEVSKRIVASIAIPVPPIAEQRRFRAMAEQVRQVKLRANAATTRCDVLFRLLLHGVFSASLAERLPGGFRAAAGASRCERNGNFGS